MKARLPLMAGDNQRFTLFLIWIAAALLVALSCMQAYGLVDESRNKELAAAERDLANLTRVSQEHANRTLRSADQVIRFVTERYLQLGKQLDLEAMSAQGIIDTEIFNQVGIIDAKGIYVLANRPITGQLDLSDREHFKVHVSDNTRGLFVSKPVLGRATGKWSIQLTRRINTSHGEFAGVVVISIDPGYFTRFYGELKLGAHGLVALYGMDGIARARQVGDKEEFGSSAINSPLFGYMAKGQLSGPYLNRSVVDNIERLYYYRKIPGYDLVLTGGLNVEDVLADSERARVAFLRGAGAMSLLILLLAAAITRHLVKIGRANAARRFAQDQAQDRTEQLNAIFALSPDGFVSFDHQHSVKYINPAFSRMTALQELRLEGMDENDFSAWLASRCDPGSRFGGLNQLRLNTGRRHSDQRVLLEITADVKRVLQVELRLSESPTVSQILYFRDVTHETEVDEMKSEFLTTAAHELRTPMTSILGFSEMLVMQETDADSKQEFMGIIHSQSKVMASILDELLDLARIEARRDKDFLYTRICLQTLLTDIVNSLTLPLGRAMPVVQMRDEPLYIEADQGKLRQAIINVLTNAYKYSPAGGPVFLELQARSGDGVPEEACIRISDQGLGMTPEQTGRVFERFYRADKSGKIPGTGLGMSIAKEIIDLHQGQITVQSALGQGTSIALCLPLNRFMPARPVAQGMAEPQSTSSHS